MTRLEKISAALRQAGYDAVLLTGEENMRYATGFGPTEGMVFITADGKGYSFTDSRYIEAAGNAIRPRGYQVELPCGTYPQQAAALVEKHGVKKLAFEDRDTTVAVFESYRAEIRCEMLPLGGFFEVMREVKEPEEIACIERAQRIAEKAFDEILGLIQPGKTEKELAAELDYRMAKLGSEGPSFGTIFISGAKGSMPHGVPDGKKIEKGDFIVIDFGAMIDGYHSDMTRTVAVDHATNEMRRVYDIVLQAQLAGIEALDAGKTGHEVDKAARDVITAAGYGECFGHNLGHSLGLNIHENPRAGRGHQTRFQVGSIITMEPGIYLPGKFGVRIEDMVYISGTGKVNLTHTPKELLIV